MVDENNPESSGSEDETLKAPPCPQCQGEADPIRTIDGRILYLCSKCDAAVREKILAEMGHDTKKS